MHAYQSTGMQTKTALAVGAWGSEARGAAAWWLEVALGGPGGVVCSEIPGW